MLQVQSINKSFKRDGTTFNVLDNISFTIDNGEFICLLGGSGCGKSTLLNIIAGFETPDTGKVMIDGEVVTGPDRRRQMIFQNYGLLPWLTVEQNVNFGLENEASLTAEQRKARVAKYLKLVALEAHANAYPSQLSGGMQQRVAIARALAVEPEVIYLDEPFGALDAITRMNLQDELLRIRREGNRTVIMVTHDVDEAAYLADRILVMKAAPGNISRDIHVNRGATRDRTTPEFVRLRATLLQELGFASKHEVEYNI